MRSMKIVHVLKAGEDSEVLEREIPQPDPGQVRIRFLAGNAGGVFGRERRVVRGGHDITVFDTAGREG